MRACSVGIEQVAVSNRSHFRAFATYAKLPREIIDFRFSHRLSRVYGCGVVATGALGIQKFVSGQAINKFSVSVPTHLRYFSDKPINIRSVSCGFGFTLFIGSHHKHKSVVYGCGLNSDGQLGFQSSGIHASVAESFDVNVVPEPSVIPLYYNENSLPYLISCGRAHSLIAMKTQDNHTTLYALGNNAFGQCAREMIKDEIFASDHPQVTRVVLPDDVENIKQIECGQDHSLLVSGDGCVFSAGLSNDGQTGLGSTKCIDALTKVRGALEGLKVKQISSRGDTVLALTECGRVFAWGNNEYSQIWTNAQEIQVLEPTELPVHACAEGGKMGPVVQVAAAGSMCAVLDVEGQVFVWGFGCLGLGPRRLQASNPSLIPPALFVPAVPHSENRIIDVVSGLHHFVARSANGLLWSWGAPRAGLACLGLGTAPRNTPEAPNKSQTYPVPLSLPANAIHPILRSRLLPLYLWRSYSQDPPLKRCYYAVLGVPFTASTDEIKVAYFKKCKSTHPDATFTTDSSAFLEVTNAYNVLGNPELRRAYDKRLGTAWTYRFANPSEDPFFSCSPYGPKISFHRANDGFRCEERRQNEDQSRYSSHPKHPVEPLALYSFYLISACAVVLYLSRSI